MPLGSVAFRFVTLPSQKWSVMMNFIAIAIVFQFMWVAISLLLSQIGGWSRLANRYADTGNESGETYTMRSGYIGAVNYKSCLTLSVCHHGLRLSVLFLFRIGHPPLFIPWDHFHSVSEKRILFLRFLSMSVGTPLVSKVILPIWLREHLPMLRDNRTS